MPTMRWEQQPFNPIIQALHGNDEWKFILVINYRNNSIYRFAEYHNIEGYNTILKRSFKHMAFG